MTAGSYMARKHVLFIGFPLFGSLNPFLELAKKVSKHHDVTFAISQCRIEELEGRGFHTENNSQGGSSFPYVTLYSLNDDADIADMEMTSPNPSTATIRKPMKDIFEGVNNSIEKLVKEVATKDSPGSPETKLQRAVDAVIVDFFVLSGSTAVCVERRIPFYVFSSSNALVPLQALLVDKNTPTRPGDVLDTMDEFDQMPNEDGQFEPLLNGGRVEQLLLPMRKAFIASRGVIMNSVREFEKELIDWMERSPIIQERQLFCVAPLSSEEEGVDTKTAKMKAWLDGKEPGSVVYIAFGSLLTPRREQLMELGKAVASLDRPYIWSLKAVHYPHIPASVAENVNKWDGQGLVLPWVPQKLILDHSSVGVFVSHSGLNSTVESLSAGKSMVCCPVSFDHLITGQTAVKHGVGVMVGPEGFHKDAELIEAEHIVGAIHEAEQQCTEKAAEWRQKISHALHFGGATAKELNELITSISRI